MVLCICKVLGLLSRFSLVTDSRNHLTSAVWLCSYIRTFISGAFITSAAVFFKSEGLCYHMHL